MDLEDVGGQEHRATKGVASARWFHWLLVCGVVSFVLATGVLFMTWYSPYVRPARLLYAPQMLLLYGLLLVLLAISIRYGVAAAARHSVWVFLLAMLMAITCPRILAPTRKGLQASCQSNLKQIGFAVGMYMEDYDDRLPPAHSWQEALQPYISEESRERLLQCPRTDEPYVFNDGLAGKSLEDIPNPAETPVAWDTLTDDGKPLHIGGFNVLFLDGHVDWFKLAEFSERRYDKSGFDKP